MGNECEYDVEMSARESVEGATEAEANAKANAAALALGDRMGEIFKTTAEDTSSNGLLPRMKANDNIDTDNLTAEGVPDLENKQTNVETGERIKVVLQTDDHPRNIRWSLYDVCPGGRIIKTSPPYDTPGEYTDEILNRKSRYMYVIIDTAGDGICCNHGPHGFFEVSVDDVVQFRGGDDGPFTTKTEYFGECSSPTTLKPTNAITASPTNNPTSNPTSDDKRITVTIKFDRHPEDISWQLFRQCTPPVLLGSGGEYDSTNKMKEVKVYDQTVNDGYFEFKIVDSYGDGLCCGNGFGGYTITYGDTEIEDDFEGNNQGPFEAIQSFGDKSKCGAVVTSMPTSNPTSNPTSISTSNPTSNPTPVSTPSPTKSPPSPIASFDSVLRAPRCSGTASPCTTVGSTPSLTLNHGLLSWKGALGTAASPQQEENLSNTISNSCADGQSGLYNNGDQNTESVESITVEAVGAGRFVQGNQVRITAKIWAFGPSNRVEFYLTADPEASIITWDEVGQVQATQFSEFYDISITAMLKSTSLQAVRVVIVYGAENGNSGPRSCPTAGASGTFSDTDDLIFPVDSTPSGGTLSSSGGTLGLAPLPVDIPIAMVKVDCTKVPPSRCAVSNETCPDACNNT